MNIELPKDAERREIAAWVRGPFDVVKEGRYYHLNGTLFGMGLYANTENGLRIGMSHLADLIEPEPERTCHMEPDETASHAMCGPAVRCDACGAAVPAVGTLSYCPNCGAKVVEDE